MSGKKDKSNTHRHRLPGFMTTSSSLMFWGVAMLSTIMVLSNISNVESALSTSSSSREQSQHFTYLNSTSTTASLDLTYSRRQNVCPRQQQLWQSLSSNSNSSTTTISAFSNALQGLELNVGIVVISHTKVPQEQQYFNMLQEESGIITILIDELAKRGQFKWRNSYDAYNILPSSIDETMSTSSWQEWMVLFAKTYDVTISPLWDYDTSSYGIGKGVQYLDESWYDSTLVLIGKTETNATTTSNNNDDPTSLLLNTFEDQDLDPDDEEDQFNPTVFLDPFAIEVWCTIFATFIFSGLIYVFLEWVDPYSDRRSLKKKPIETIFMSAMGFAGHMEFEARTHPARLFTFSLALWALLMAAAYTANLVNFLVPTTSSTTTLDTLVVDDDYGYSTTLQTQASTNIDHYIQNQYPVCVVKNTSTEDQIRKDYPNFPNVVTKSTEEEVLEGVLNGECNVAILYRSAWDGYWKYNSSTDGDCNNPLHKVGQYRYPKPSSGIGNNNHKAGIATISSTFDDEMLCTSLVRDVLNLHMIQMKEDGFIAQAWEQHVQQLLSVDKTTTRTMTQPDCLDNTTVDSSGNNNSNRRQRYLQQQKQLQQQRILAGGKRKASSAAGDLTTGADPLTIKSTGGIFIMHATLSVVAIILALIHRAFGLTARRNKERQEKCLRRQLKKIEAKRAFSVAVTPSQKRKTLINVMKYENEDFTSGDGKTLSFNLESEKDLSLSTGPKDTSYQHDAENNMASTYNGDYSIPVEESAPRSNSKENNAPTSSAFESILNDPEVNAVLGMEDNLEEMQISQRKQGEVVEDLQGQMYHLNGQVTNLQDQMAILQGQMSTLIQMMGDAKSSNKGST